MAVNLEDGSMRSGMKWSVFWGVVLAVVSVQAAKPDGAAALKLLQDGNERFAAGTAAHPNGDKARRELAAKSNQGDYALATIVSCSDSRVPVELIFDTGIMDVFVIRVAGNVCGVSELGTIEYGVCHVKTPVLLMLGHSQCGAVTAVAQAQTGHGHALEKNIPPLVAPIVPAVQKVRQGFPQATPENLVARAIEENVWMGLETVFMRSAAVREAAKSGALKVVAGIYELETGKVRWLASERVAEILKKVEADPGRELQVMAGEAHAPAAAADHEAKPASTEAAPQADPHAASAPAEPAAHGGH
jgi:carbonic anhydrase